VDAAVGGSNEEMQEEQEVNDERNKMIKLKQMMRDSQLK
jgi:hypothetical protein